MSKLRSPVSANRSLLVDLVSDRVDPANGASRLERGTGGRTRWRRDRRNERNRLPHRCWIGSRTYLDPRRNQIQRHRGHRALYWGVAARHTKIRDLYRVAPSPDFTRNRKRRKDQVAVSTRSNR